MVTTVREGMMVVTSDGERVGKVIKVGPSDFLVEKGRFFKKDYLCRFDDIAGASGDELRLGRSMGQLRELPRDYWEEGATARTAGPSTAEPTATGRGAAPIGKSTGYTQETRVPLAEEQLVAEKTAREKGAVEIKKEVRTETKRVDVPVTKEEVTVSRTPVNRPAAPGEATFKESSVSIPVVEEDVEVTKRPVVREEVRAAKTSHEEVRSAEAEVRREEAHVETKPGMSGPGRRGR